MFNFCLYNKQNSFAQGLLLNGVSINKQSKNLVYYLIRRLKIEDEWINILKSWLLEELSLRPLTSLLQQKIKSEILFGSLQVSTLIIT